MKNCRQFCGAVQLLLGGETLSRGTDVLHIKFCDSIAAVSASQLQSVGLDQRAPFLCEGCNSCAHRFIMVGYHIEAREAEPQANELNSFAMERSQTISQKSDV